MSFHYQPWNKGQMREQLAVVRGEVAPTLVLKNSTYLNAHTKQWEQANIWIYYDRIVYVGEQLPETGEGTVYEDCSGRYLVPGYVEPHAHPFQLYNPHTFAEYAAERGTTTVVCDNMVFFLLLDDEQSLSILDRLNDSPTSFFWWCRYDAQTILKENKYTDDRIRKWLEHPNVIQGGELTAWPQVLHGDDTILEWMNQTRKYGKQIEGHLPGASEKTLTQLELLGVTCDHEAMTGEEAMRRLRLGLSTSLRYSSIRPDLPDILEDLLSQDIQSFERLYMTTDGSTPDFYREGVMDRTIEIALEKGVPVIDAYLMATANPARHYGMNPLVGEIAPGRIAHINVLEAEDKPTPVSVLAKGQWVKKQSKTDYPNAPVDFQKEIGALNIEWDMTPEVIEPEGLLGIDMVNAVITRPFELDELPAQDQLPEGVAYLTLVDTQGEWKVSTFVRGFATNVDGFASSYSSSGDIILIGRKKDDMIRAFNLLKELNGGVVLFDQGELEAEIPLPIGGRLSPLPMKELANQERELTEKLREKGYQFADPIYSLLFFSSTHLPYVRITQLGLLEVMKGKVMQPSVTL